MSPCAATCPSWLPGSGCTRKEVGHTAIYKEILYKEKENNTAEFSFIKTTWEHAGMYRCQYQVLVLFGTLKTCDPVELVLTGKGTGDGWWFWTVLTEPHPIPVLS